jgi:hypothetical protein
VFWHWLLDLFSLVECRYGDQGDVVLGPVLIPKVEKVSFYGPVLAILEISEVSEIFWAGSFGGFDFTGVEAAVDFKYQIDFMAGGAFVVIEAIGLQKAEFPALFKF